MENLISLVGAPENSPPLEGWIAAKPQDEVVFSLHGVSPHEICFAEPCRDENLPSVMLSLHHTL